MSFSPPTSEQFERFDSWDSAASGGSVLLEPPPLPGEIQPPEDVEDWVDDDLSDDVTDDADLDDEDLVELEEFNPDEDFVPESSGRGNVAATIASIVLHVWLVFALAKWTITRSQVLPPEPINSAITEIEKIEEPEEEPEFVLANPNDKEFEVKKVVNANAVGVVRTDKPRQLSEPEPRIAEVDPDIKRRQQVFDIPEGVEVDESLVVVGTTGDGIVQMESALDRVTHEIAQNLKERKVLVIWLLDQSGSLQKQREVLAKRLKRIYGELNALERVGQLPKMKQPLLTCVAGYGAKTTFLTKSPTDVFEDIQNAVTELKHDESGVENVFTAVDQVVKRWREHRVSRRIMVVAVTDESGDDFGMVEQSIKRCRMNGAKAYVIGPAAVFGRRKGFVPYVHPADRKTYQLPVDIGPETARYEHLTMPFWFEGPQYRYLSSGFGPYALSRLVHETGGIYFTTNMFTMSGLTPIGDYDPETLKFLKPDYSFGSPVEYDRDLMKHPLRAACVAAAQYSRDNPVEGTPQLDIRVTPQNYRQVATQAQQTVARSQFFVDSILQAFPDRAERLLATEASPRWRATFCLTYGRLLAMRVRCLEYNFACADLKSNLTPQDVGSTANHWIFRPATDVKYAANMRRAAKTAKMLLQTVLDEAPGTPWAMLAQRELQNGVGIRVVKRFIAPPTPRPRNNNAAPNRPRVRLAPNPRPPRPPQRPMPRPKPPVLPKL